MKPAIVVYDGDCGICEKFRHLVEWLDWFHCFKFRQLQDEELYLQFPRLNRESCEKEAKLVQEADKIYGGADAALRIFLKLPLLFPVGLFFLLPPFRPFTHWAYRKVADNRYRISATCGLKKPE